jgi:hypothetical protein
LIEERDNILQELIAKKEKLEKEIQDAKHANHAEAEK